MQQTQQAENEQVAYGATSAATVRPVSTTSRRSTTDHTQVPSVAGPYMRTGESSVPPQISPHLCDEQVDLMLSEEDKITVMGEVQRLQVFSLVVQVQGARLNRAELRHTLYAAFSEETNNIVDIQFMTRGCYHVEFADEESVTKLLAIKEAGVEGAWLSFYKWSHNINVDDILKDQESTMLFTAIFPGLRKEWRNVLPSIGALFGKVIATRYGHDYGIDRAGGAPAVRIIAPRSRRLPTTISLPNLLINKPPVIQKVYYQGLPDQCFVCRQFGHLGRDCQKRRSNVNSDAHPTNRQHVSKDGWSTVSNKHVFKPTNKIINPLLLLEANPYQSLQTLEKEAGSSKVDGALSIPVGIMEHQQDHNTNKVQMVESSSRVSNQSSKDKQLVLHKVSQDNRSIVLNELTTKEVVKVDTSHTDMVCGNIAAFTAAKFSDSVSITDKHLPVRAHKLSGKDMWSNRRQLRATEDGRKGREGALAEKRVGGQNMNDG